MYSPECRRPHASPVRERRSILLVAFAATLLTACGGGGEAGGTPTSPGTPSGGNPPGGTPSTPAPATNLVAGGATTVSGVVGTTVPVAVRATNAAGAGVAGVSVSFAVTGGGSVAAASVTTGADGTAATTWTLGTTAGAQSVAVSAASLPSVTFSATAAPAAAASLAVSTGGGQTARVGEAVPVTPTVLIKDAYGNAVANVPVSFAVASGGGTVVGGSATTNAQGTAAVTSWTLGTRPGLHSLTVSSGTLTPLTIAATATAAAPATLARGAGEAQQGAVGATLATPLTVTVTDRFGNPVGGVPVTFAVQSGGGSLERPAAVTDSTGVASAGRWTLGSGAMTQTVAASAPSLTPVMFTATAMSNWAVSPGSTLILAGTLATEPGFADGASRSWSTTRLGSAPILSVSCFNDGVVWVALFHSRLVTKSGAVAYSFDAGPGVGAIWQEASPSYNMLYQPSNSISRALVSQMLVSKSMSIAFAEYGGATYVATFDTRGLSLVIGQVMARCP